MARKRSWKEYRRIDLALFALLLTVSEYLSLTAARVWFPGQPFTVSAAAAVTTIVYVRWGWWGGLHAALAGLAYCLFQGAGRSQYLIYIVGNLFSLPAVLVLGRRTAEGEKRAPGMGLPVLVWLLMQAGRGAVALCLGAAPRSLAGFFATDSLSLLFTALVVWIARRLDGVYEDQIHYLLRVNGEDENAGF